jgi:nitrate/TMAO reductase-like tetraheme cytochrome c subunit
MDFFAHFTNPYMGILTYFVAPFFLISGLVFVAIGIVLERRRLVRRAAGAVGLFPVIDLNHPAHRKALGSFVGFAAVFLLLTAIGSYRSYHFTESRQFCGQTCHAVMEPEFTAYQNSPHARVACVQCHIGPGAGWFVKSKLSGSYQVYSVIANKYPRPIPTPVKNLRPAQETCEQCHWPRKFYGNAERVNRHFMSDEQNSPWTIQLLMKIGGGDPSFGPVGGIHWHMNIGNTVEYIASDEARQVIPWVRITDAQGTSTVYQTTENPLTPEQVAAAKPRRMDCIDCHNRPSHIYNPPNRAVNIAMSTGRIDPAIPFVKKQAVEVLIKEYKTTDEALSSIAKTLTTYYETNHAEFAEQNAGSIQNAITGLQQIYRNNFFPEMKVNWRAYPNNIGHTIFPGCYRCHDGKHKSPDGQLISHDCKSCHTIIAQGAGTQTASIHPQGLDFEHPTDIADMWKEMNCAECHTGALAQ